MIQIKFIHSGKTNSWLKNQGYEKEEERNIYEEQLEDIYLNTRWYLDNLPFMRSYKVYWKNYQKKLKGTPTMPLKCTLKPQDI